VPPQIPGDGRQGPAVGIDIGGTKVLAVRLGPGPSVEAEVKVGTPQEGDEVVERILEVVAAVTDPDDPAASIGVGIPGLVDEVGVLRFSPHLRGLVGIPLASRIAEHAHGAAIWVGNDATAAGWAEHLIGAGQGHADQIMITLGTGIGGGLIAGGELVEGKHRYAGEPGHMVIDPHGPLCPCGQKGCWERYASGSGLGQLGREAAMAGLAKRVARLAGGDPEAVRGEHVTMAAAQGDPQAIAIMARYGWWLALGLANLTTLLDPSVIVLGGGVIDAGEVLLGPTREAFAGLVEAGQELRDVVILPAALGPQAGAIGAGILAADSNMSAFGP
jgi:glucokinase